MTGMQRAASCACGALRVSVEGDPFQINVCSCEACQKRSGSAFSYTAFFQDAHARIEGDSRTWRRAGHSGGTHDSHFCPACGVAVYATLSVIPGVVAVAAGCFADRDMPQPGRFFWTQTRHRWLAPVDGVEDMKQQ